MTHLPAMVELNDVELDAVCGGAPNAAAGAIGLIAGAVAVGKFEIEDTVDVGNITIDARDVADVAVAVLGIAVA